MRLNCFSKNLKSQCYLNKLPFKNKKNYSFFTGLQNRPIPEEGSSHHDSFQCGVCSEGECAQRAEGQLLPASFLLSVFFK